MQNTQWCGGSYDIARILDIHYHLGEIVKLAAVRLYSLASLPLVRTTIVTVNSLLGHRRCACEYPRRLRQDTYVTGAQCLGSSKIGHHHSDTGYAVASVTLDVLSIVASNRPYIGIQYSPG